MGATPKYGLRYPELTDPADVPADMRNLATDTENAISGQNFGFPAPSPTPPASPVDGQLWLMMPASPHNGTVWVFRYNAGSSSAYKWECVGGAAWVNATPGTSTLVAVGTWYNISGSATTLPRAGEYDISGAMKAITPAGGLTTVRAQVTVAGTRVGFTGSLTQEAGGYEGPVVLPPQIITVTAGQGVTLQASGSQANAQVTESSFATRPIRVS